MAKIKVILWIGSTSPVPKDDPGKNKRYIDLQSLDEAQKAYFRKAHEAFRKNPSCWEFDGAWLNSAQFNVLVPGKTAAEITQHPLWRALGELWLALGVNQGQMKSEREEIICFLI